MDLPPLPSGAADREGYGDWLESAAASVKAQHRSSRSRDLSWAWLRLLLFLCMPIGVYYFTNHAATWGLALSIAGCLGFWVSVRFHRLAQTRTLTLRLLMEVIAESQERSGGGKGGCVDNGDNEGKPVIIRSGHAPKTDNAWDTLVEHLRANQPTNPLSEQEIDDLDLFGEPLSLYGILNRASTPAGARRLHDILVHPLQSPDAILDRQSATRWLAEHDAERMYVSAAAAGLRPLPGECENLYQAIRDATPLPHRVSTILLRLWGLAGPIALGLAFADVMGWVGAAYGSIPLAIVLIINIILMPTFNKEVRKRIRPWLELDTVVPRLRFFAETAAASLPTDGLLAAQRERLLAAVQPGCLPTLEKRIPLLFLGLSGMFHTIIDILMFWDLQCLWLLERCYLNHRTELLDAFAALAECESLTSLGCFAAEETGIAWPTFTTKGCCVDITDGRHPLIPAADAVPNSLALTDAMSTWIITGSNMSGKSTFLRMAGTNVLLAQIGSATTAASVSLSPVKILTDLRIRDDLSRKESYFLAEVRQVRRMVQAAKSGDAVFALIDEPFRGTNSGERLAAAMAVARVLIRGSGIHLIATHDAALTRLGEEEKAVNRHFQESFAKDKLVFDYSLRDGPAESRNALRVLEAEGYPADLVQHATEVLNELNEPK